jgi:hypothetical protein
MNIVELIPRRLEDIVSREGTPPRSSQGNSMPKRPFSGSESYQFSESLTQIYVLKGLSHQIFGPVYWPVWMHLGLNKNRFWFLNFKGAPSI